MNSTLKKLSEIIAEANDLLYARHTSIDTIMGIMDEALRKQGIMADAVTVECIPVNKKTIVPKWVIPLRFLVKVPFAVLGSKGKSYWHQFEISFFYYWMDVTHSANTVSYWRSITDVFRSPRNSVSWMVEDYINNLKNRIYKS